MKRIASIALLAALALPYARTPICSSAGHEHGDDHHMAKASLTSHDTHGGDASDCHRLMACDTTITGVTPIVVASTEVRTGLISRSSSLSSRYEGPVRIPIPPPPQTV